MINIVALIVTWLWLCDKSNNGVNGGHKYYSFNQQYNFDFDIFK